MPEFERYVAPQTLAEALDVLSAGDATILAGGTDLMPQTRSGKLPPRPVLMNIQHVAELRGIATVDGSVRIGALTRVTELMASPVVRERLPILWQSCDHFASDQIRNIATLGGNICNASPAGDTLVPLLVLSAMVELSQHSGGKLRTRSLPVADFVTGPGRTRREPGELLTAVEMPLPRADWVCGFLKFGTRPALDIATVAIGLGGVLVGRALHDVRVVFGAVAPTPIRSRAAERTLEGRPLDDAAIEAAVRAADEDIRPISDVRASDWYRHELVRNLLRRMLRNVR